MEEQKTNMGPDAGQARDAVEPRAQARPHPGRFSYVAYDQYAKHQSEQFKAKFEELEQLTLISLADGRPKSLVLTKLEEAFMWVGKAIRDQQIASGGDAAHLAGRSNE